MPRALVISQNLLVASGGTDAERWWTNVPTRAIAACWDGVGTHVSPRVRSSCRLSWEASRAYLALSFATWTVMLSSWRAVSESSAIKGATYWLSSPKDREDDLLHYFWRREGVEAPVAQRVLALQGEFPIRQ